MADIEPYIEPRMAIIQTVGARLNHDAAHNIFNEELQFPAGSAVVDTLHAFTFVKIAGIKQ